MSATEDQHRQMYLAQMQNFWQKQIEVAQSKDGHAL
jgi:hypothetical protein